MQKECDAQPLSPRLRIMVLPLSIMQIHREYRAEDTITLTQNVTEEKEEAPDGACAAAWCAMQRKSF